MYMSGSADVADAGKVAVIVVVVAFHVSLNHIACEHAPHDSLERTELEPLPWARLKSIL